MGDLRQNAYSLIKLSKFKLDRVIEGLLHLHAELIRSYEANRMTETVPTDDPEYEDALNDRYIRSKIIVFQLFVKTLSAAINYDKLDLRFDNDFLTEDLYKDEKDEDEQEETLEQLLKKQEEEKLMVQQQQEASSLNDASSSSNHSHSGSLTADQMQFNDTQSDRDTVTDDQSEVDLESKIDKFDEVSTHIVLNMIDWCLLFLFFGGNNTTTTVVEVNSSGYR